MRRHVDHVVEQTKGTYIWAGGRYGDWLSFQDMHPSGISASTSKDLVGTAFLAHSAGLVAKAALVLDRDDDVEIYTAHRDAASAPGHHRVDVSHTDRIAVVIRDAELHGI